MYRCNATSFNLFQNKFLSSIHSSFSIITVPNEHHFYTEKGVFFWKFKTCALSPTAKETRLFGCLSSWKKMIISYFLLLFFQISAEISVGEPYKGCATLSNADDLKHRIAVLERGECMFIDKVLWSPLQAYGGVILKLFQASFFYWSLWRLATVV